METSTAVQSSDQRDLKSLLSSLTKEEVKPQATPPDTFQQHSLFSKKFLESAIAIGQAAYASFQNDEPPSEYCWISTYEWPEITKRFSLFLRDYCFELSRSIIMHKDKQASNKQFKDFLIASAASFEKAKSEYIKETEKIFSQSEAIFLKKKEQWKHERNPWPAYHKQFALISSQIDDLSVNFEILTKAQNIYAKIKKSSLDNFKNALNQYELINTLNNKALNIVNENCQAKSVENFARMAEQLELLKRNLRPLPNSISSSTTWKALLKNYPDRHK